MKLKKGSLAAKRYMAKLRSMQKCHRKKNYPLLVMGNPQANHPLLIMGNKGKVSKEGRKYISKKIRKLIHEGYPPPQATAIAYDMARRKGFHIPVPAANPGLSNFPFANNPMFLAELKAFRKRHGKSPVQIIKVKVPKGYPKFMTALGTAPDVKYDASRRSSKLGKRIHKFGDEGGRRPWLVSSVEKGKKFLGYAGGSFEVGEDWIYK